METERQSRVLGIVFTIGDVGSALGPPLALILVPIISVAGVYKICAGLFGLAGIFAVWQTLQEDSLKKTLCSD